MAVFTTVFRIIANTKSKEACSNTIGTSHRCPVKSLDEFVKSTHFSKKQVQFLYRKFKQDFPAGAASEQDFLTVYRKMFPHSDTCKYSRYIYTALTKAQNQPFVTFEDFIKSLDILSNGTNEDKLGWIYDLYDTKHTNKLTVQDIEDLLTAVCDLTGQKTFDAERGASNIVRQEAKSFFKILNGAEKGYVDRNSFVQTFCEDCEMFTNNLPNSIAACQMFMLPLEWQQILSRVAIQRPCKIHLNRVFVSGFHSEVSESDLQETFTCFGTVEHVRIVRKVIPSESYAFVSFQDADPSLTVLKCAERSIECKNRWLIVKPAFEGLKSFEDELAIVYQYAYQIIPSAIQWFPSLPYPPERQ